MLRWLIHRKLRAFERQNHYDASYLHEVLDTDLDAFQKFNRKDVPADVWAAASLTSSVQADCGPCTQLGVGFALAAGVPAPTLAAIVRGDVEALAPEAALGVRFARAVLARDAAADDLRAEIARRWGPRAVLALAFGVMAAQLYPALKYATGHGQACLRISVAGQTVVPPRPRLAAGAA